MTRSSTRQDLSNLEIVVFALAALGGAERPIHLEKIAVRAFQISPGAFRWDLEEFANYIDKDKVRVSLTDAEKPNKGTLARGTGPQRRSRKASSGRKVDGKRTDLWQLTSQGMSWFVKNQARIEEALEGPRVALRKPRAAAVRKRLTETSLYRQYAGGEISEADPYAFTDLLECSPDASNELIASRFDWLRSQVELLDDQDLIAFLEACGEAHSDMLDLED